jgi:chaperone required for assembly of F1-ATPase
VIFGYINKAQNISQTFGVNLKYYKPHNQLSFENKETHLGVDAKEVKDPGMKMKMINSEGAYTLRVEWEGKENK